MNMYIIYCMLCTLIFAYVFVHIHDGHFSNVFSYSFFSFSAAAAKYDPRSSFAINLSGFEDFGPTLDILQFK